MASPLNHFITLKIYFPQEVQEHVIQSPPNPLSVTAGSCSKYLKTMNHIQAALPSSPRKL